MLNPLDSHAQRQIFLDAHTTFKFSDVAVTDEALRQLYELCKWGPTAMNGQPMRLVFVRSGEGKQRLKPALSLGNVDKTMAAPVTAIVAFDSAFHEHLATQSPAIPSASAMYANNPGLAQETAFRNGSLQGAYLIVAARMLGLATGAMSGFNAAVLDEAFFPDGRWRSNFLVNLGYAAPKGHRPRGPRLAFNEAVRFA